MDIGLEVVSVNNGGTRKTMYLVFRTKADRDLVYGSLHSIVSPSCVTTEQTVETFTKLWCEGKMTNFDYLMLLNSYA